MKKLTQKNKALIFDKIFDGVSSGTLEILEKEDFSGELDFETINDEESLIMWVKAELLKLGYQV